MPAHGSQQGPSKHGRFNAATWPCQRITWLLANGLGNARVAGDSTHSANSRLITTQLHSSHTTRCLAKAGWPVTTRLCRVATLVLARACQTNAVYVCDADQC
jgi:hypothetical protein